MATVHDDDDRGKQCHRRNAAVGARVENDLQRKEA
jgi:hypothetical protein